MTGPAPRQLAGNALVAELQRLRQVFAGAGTPGENGYLAPVTADRAMVAGSTAPALISRFAPAASGLLVPQRLAAGPAPIDLIQLYITAEELFGTDVPLELVADHLSRSSLEDVLTFCAGWLNARHRLGVDRRAVDAAFAETYLAGPARARAYALLRDPTRALVAPQGLFVLMKLACVYSGDAVLPGVQPGTPALALLGLMNHLTSDEPLADDNVITGPAGRLGREIISNQLFHSHRSVAGAIRRFMRRWVELPRELATDPRVVDLASAFEQSTGVALGDLVLVLFAMWGAANDGRPRFALSYFDQLGWEPQRLQSTLAVFVTDTAHLRADVMSEAAEFEVPWAIATFERFPVVRLPDDSLLVLDSQLLGRRLLGLLPLYDLTHALSQSGDRKGKKRVEGCYAHVSEAYALEVLSAATPSAGVTRMYGEQALRDAYGRNRQVVDAAIDHGDEWVAVEITTSRPQRGTVSGHSDDAVSADLDKLVAKAAQLESTIAALRADQSALTGAAAVPNQRFRPVLVVADGFPVNPISLTLLRGRLQAAGVLQQPDTAPLEVLDLEELEMVEHLATSGGPSLRDLLAGHERSGVMANAALREYILVALRLNPRQDAREKDAMDRMVSWALRRTPDLAA